MADQLYLSIWLRGFTAENMLRHYEKLLRTFPFSRLSNSASGLRIYSADFTEPPAFERAFNDPVDVDEVLKAARETQHPDYAYMFETWWDLWQWQGDWKLSPARVSLNCFGPEFQGGGGENLRIDFGIDASFLPQTEHPNSLFISQSNLRGLLHLVRQFDDTLAIEKRRLWTESGENFAERIEQVLAGKVSTEDR